MSSFLDMLLVSFSVLLQDTCNRSHCDKFSVPDWEKVKFFPTVHVRTHPSWVTLGGGCPLLTSHASAEQVLKGEDFDIESLPVRDPEGFVAGQLHENLLNWEYILDNLQESDENMNVRLWLENGVDVLTFFQHFQGDFKGKNYDLDLPPKQYFPNATICRQYIDFICAELNNKIASGAICVLGKIGECELPKVIMPLTIEPSKPRLCLDDRYVNL